MREYILFFSGATWEINISESTKYQCLNSSQISANIQPIFEIVLETLIVAK